MGESKPRQRAKHKSAPPHVCPDCYWRRCYYELSASFITLRAEMFKLLQERRSRHMKRGSYTMPTEQTFKEIADDPETDKLLDGFNRKGEP